MKESVQTITGGLQAGVWLRIMFFCPSAVSERAPGLLGNIAFYLASSSKCLRTWILYVWFFFASAPTPESKSGRVFIIMFPDRASTGSQLTDRSSAAFSFLLQTRGRRCQVYRRAIYYRFSSAEREVCRRVRPEPLQSDPAQI